MHKQLELFGYRIIQNRISIISSIIICCTVPDTENCSSFIPVSRIAAHCAIIPKAKVNFDCGDDSVCICVPLINGILV